MDNFHIYINDHSFVVQSSTWIIFTFISMISHLLFNHQHGYFSHLYQWSLICCPIINMDTFHIYINDHSFSCQINYTDTTFFVHRNLNTAWYNRSHSLIEKPYLAIIARNYSQKSQQSSGHESLFIFWNDVIFKNSCLGIHRPISSALFTEHLVNFQRAPAIQEIRWSSWWNSDRICTQIQRHNATS